MTKRDFYSILKKMQKDAQTRPVSRATVTRQYDNGYLAGLNRIMTMLDSGATMKAVKAESLRMARYGLSSSEDGYLLTPRTAHEDGYKAAAFWVIAFFLA